MRLRRLAAPILVGLSFAVPAALILYQPGADRFGIVWHASVRDSDVARSLEAILSDRRAAATFRSDRTLTVVRDFYQRRQFAPLWISRAEPSNSFVLARNYLGTVESEGLEPNDYPLPDITGDSHSLARAELMTTRALLRYAEDAYSGRVSPAKLSANVSYPGKSLDVPAFLSGISSAQTVVPTLRSLHPVHRHYLALKQALADLRAGAPPWRPEMADTMMTNMERWRWLPRFEPTHVVVNIPDYELRLLHNGEPAFVARAVVGRSSTPTPLLATTMTSLTFNPVWNVPQSIAEGEEMKALAEDAGLRRRDGFSLAVNHDGGVRIAQNPGISNPLGRVRFNIPNVFAVYLHDTPDTFLFEQPNRAFSHGCVRVENALSYAATILSMQDDGADAMGRLGALLSADNVEVPLASPLPVYLTYETLTQDETGGWQRAPDLYGYDAALIKLLRGRRVEPSTMTLASAAPGFEQIVRRIYRQLASGIRAVASL